MKPRRAADFIFLVEYWESINKLHLSPAFRNLARDSYDNCVAYLDERLGDLFAELQKRGLLDHTLIIVTSDHGEGLGEHGLFDHGESLYRNEIRVPLVIVPPERDSPAQLCAKRLACVICRLRSSIWLAWERVHRCRAGRWCVSGASLPRKPIGTNPTERFPSFGARIHSIPTRVDRRLIADLSFRSRMMAMSTSATSGMGRRNSSMIAKTRLKCAIKLMSKP